MKSSHRSRALTIPPALFAIVGGLLLTRGSTPLFGIDRDLLGGLAVGIGVGLLAVMIVFATVKAPIER